MRRITLRRLVATAALGAMLAAPPALLPSRAADGDPDAAQVLVSEGTTMLVRGASFSTPVRREVPIRSGDRIRTGPDGRVQLRFSDGALISIQPGSDFRVAQYAFDAVRQRSFFELMQGSVRAVSGSIGKRDREDWRMRTPTATIGIRGTEFVVTESVCPAGGCTAADAAGLTVTVIAGRVAVSNRAGSVEVPAGASLSLRDATTVPALASDARSASPARSSPRPADDAAGVASARPPRAGSAAGAPPAGAASPPLGSDPPIDSAPGRR